MSEARWSVAVTSAEQSVGEVYALSASRSFQLPSWESAAAKITLDKELADAREAFTKTDAWQSRRNIQEVIRQTNALLDTVRVAGAEADRRIEDALTRGEFDTVAETAAAAARTRAGLLQERLDKSAQMLVQAESRCKGEWHTAWSARRLAIHKECSQRAKEEIQKIEGKLPEVFRDLLWTLATSWLAWPAGVGGSAYKSALAPSSDWTPPAPAAAPEGQTAA